MRYGFDGVLALNTSDDPTVTQWAVIDAVGDVSLDDDSDEVDASRRSSRGRKQTVRSLISRGLSFAIGAARSAVGDSIGARLLRASRTRAGTIDVCIFDDAELSEDGLTVVSGGGIRFAALVKLTANQPLGDRMVDEYELKPGRPPASWAAAGLAPLNSAYSKLVSTAPVLTVPGTQSATEDTNKAISGISIADEDGDAQTVTLSATHGTLTLAQTTGLTFALGDGTADASMEFSGSLVDVNAALATVTYIPTANYNGSAAVSIVTDDGNEGTDSDSITVNVGAINDAPVLTVPGTQSATEDTNKAISGISIADVESNAQTVTLSVTNGTLTLAQTTGLTFASGDGTADASMEFSGTLTNVNAAIATVTYSPSSNYNGSAAVSIATNDGNGGTDSDSITINVAAANDAPVITVPGTQTATEDTNKAITGISIADVDGNAQTITLSVTNGTLTLAQLTGLTFASGDGTADASMQFSGSLVNVNAALATVTYIPTANYNGSSTLSIATNDGAGGTDSDTMTINVGAINDAPVLTVPGTQSATEDTNKAITGISIADVESNAQTITLSVTNGTLTLAQTTGLTFASGDGTADASMEFSGSLANVNAALATVTYIPTANYHGSAALSIATDDGNGGTDSDSVTINVASVNDVPSITVPGTQSTNEDTNKAITGISIADADSDAQTVTLSVTNGTLTLAQTTGLSFASGDGTADASMEFSGTLTNVNAAIATVTYIPTANYHGSSTLSIATNDGNGGTDSDSVTINVASVNDVPSITVPGTQSTNEDTNKAITGISIADADSDAQTVTLSATHGTLTLAQTTGLTFASGDGTADASMEFSGTLTNVNAALATVTYIPTANYNGSAAVSIATNDGNGGTDSDSITINVGAINDAPVLTVPGTQSATEDTNKDITGISIADVESNAQTVTLSVTNGTLTLAQTTGLTFASGDGTADASMEFSGSLANVNAALATVTYIPTASYTGSSTLSIATNDGAGGTDSDTVTINVAAASSNSAPVISAPVRFAGTVGGSFFYTDEITIADADSDPQTVTLTLTDGELTLGTTTGLTFSVDDGETMTFSGSLANVNAALATLSADVGTIGVFACEIHTDDGNGGTDDAEIPVYVGDGSSTATIDLGADESGITDPAFALPIDPIAGSAGEPFQVNYSGPGGSTLALASTAGIVFNAGADNSDFFQIMGTQAALNAALSGAVFTPTDIGEWTLNMELEQPPFQASGFTSDSITLEFV